MNNERHWMDEKILDLTLEIIYLLTGEDHMVVRKTGVSSHQIPKAFSRIQRLRTVTPPNCPVNGRINDQKILYLTNKIIELLTGEVPIRCEDVTVYFSMEEWEYVEAHKHLYNDVIMENHQSLCSLEKCVPVGFLTSDSLPGFEPNFQVGYKTCGEGKSLKVNKPTKGLNLRSTDIFTHREYREAEYASTHSKEESASCEVGNLTDISILLEHPPTDYLQLHIKEEPGVCQGKTLPDPDRSIHTEQMENTLTYIEDCLNSKTITPNKFLIESGNIGKKINFRSGKCPITYNTEEILNSTDRLKHFNKNSELIKRHSADNEFVVNETNEKQQKTHTGEKPFKCPECGRSYTWASQLASHRRNHTGEKPFKCTECGKCYIWASQLASHKRVHTGEKPFKCVDCGKCFNLKYDLMRHQRIHTGEKPFACSECGKCFNQHSNLSNHQKFHKGEKPFKCTECGKCFKVKQDLIRHLKFHTGEKPFSCPECGKCFTLASQLASHKRIHTGEKPFKCTECGKYFNLKHDLVRHQKIHTGEKPFSCCECGKCFTQAAHLSRHRKIHVAEKPV
ncbi:gastrula zinc finger protein XlCGF26.1-like [Pelobates fuscus]|uniref:gastrula zinc finger protein XlCGF26.1-like n=1 Tax=Pelobates fuscus TaxID=191477 RepID=UPI002FE4A6F2